MIKNKVFTPLHMQHLWEETDNCLLTVKRKMSDAVFQGQPTYLSKAKLRGEPVSEDKILCSRSGMYSILVSFLPSLDVSAYITSYREYIF